MSDRPSVSERATLAPFRHGERAGGRSPRVGIAGLFLRYPQTGTGRYARRVLEQIALAPTIQPVVITDSGWESGGHERESWCRSAGQPKRLEMVRAPRAPLRLNSYGEKLYWEQVGLRLAALRLGVDVLYSPHFSLPLFPGVPAVISVHDLIPLTEPGYAGSIPTRLYFALVGATAKQAVAVTTLSRYSQGEIERLLGIPRSRIHVIPPGVEPHFNPEPDQRAAARARERLNLPERYLLYVGGADARKNIGILLEALARVRDRTAGCDGHVANGPDGSPSLVIAAPVPRPAPSAHHPDWRAMAASYGGVQGAVQFVERIEEEDLPAVYRGAVALLFPSRAEGFGLTPLEAMACGTPVVCSNATSLPEAVGDAGILLPPDDAERWAGVIERICGDPDLRRGLREAGLRQASGFRWEDTGQRVVEVLLSAADGRRDGLHPW